MPGAEHLRSPRGTQRGRRLRGEQRVLQGAGRVEYAPQRRARGTDLRQHLIELRPRGHVAPHHHHARSLPLERGDRRLTLGGWSPATEQHQAPGATAREPFGDLEAEPPESAGNEVGPVVRDREAPSNGDHDRRRAHRMRHHVLAHVRARHERAKRLDEVVGREGAHGQRREDACLDPLHDLPQVPPEGRGSLAHHSVQINGEVREVPAERLQPDRGRAVDVALTQLDEAAVGRQRTEPRLDRIARRAS